MLDLPDFRLEVYFARREFTAKYHLAASDAETMTIAEVLALASDQERDSFLQLALSYQPTEGSAPLRSSVAELYETCSADNIVAFAGAEEAMFWALAELLTPGDHAVVTVPNYQSMEEIPRAAGADLSGMPLIDHDGWRFELDELEGLIQDNTRLVAINFPNNPTGFVPDRDVFTDVVRLCDERGIWLFSDEVYRGVELDPSRRLPHAADLSQRAISLGVMSKAFGLPGLRVGWIACRDHELLARLERRKHYTSICNAGPSEALATIALNNAERVLAKNRGIIETNLPLFDSFFEKWSELFDWYHPDGGCVVFPRYLGEEGAEALCEELLDQQGVLLLPPSIYRSELQPVGQDRFRIGVGRRDPEPALEAFDTFLRSRRTR